jgi:hypothetical protein
VNAFDLWGVQGVKLVLITGLLAQDALCAFQRRGKRRFQRRVPGYLAPDVPGQPSQAGPHVPQPAQALLVAPAMQQPRNLTPGPGRQPKKRLPQFDPMTFRRPVQPFDRPQDQMAVRRMRHRLGLHCGIHGDPLQLALADRLGSDRNRDRFGQQGLQITRPDALAPAGHR